MKKIAGVTIFCIILFLPILLSAGYISYVDMTFPMLFSRFEDQILTTWVNGGNYNNVGNLPRSVVLLPISLLHYLYNPFDTAILTRILFFVPFFISVIFSYLLTEKVLRIVSDKINFQLLFVCLISNLSPWVLNHAWTFYIWVGYSGMVASTYFLIRGYVDKDYRQLLYASPFLIMLTSAPHTTLIFLVECAVFFIFLFLLNVSKISKLIDVVAYFLSLGTLFLILNVFWIFPYYNLMKSGGGFSPEYQISPGLIRVLSENNTLLNLFTFNGGWHEASIKSLSSSNPLSALLLLIPILFTLALLITRRKKPLVNFFITLSLLGLFLATAPIIAPRIYNYIAFDSVIAEPIGWAFRSPYRWLALYNISLPIILMHLALYFNGKWQEIGRKVYGIILVLVFIGIIPSLTYLFVFKYEPTVFPDSYLEAVKSAETRNNTLYFPQYGLGGYRSTWSIKRIGDFVQQNSLNSLTETDSDGRLFTGYLYSLLKSDAEFTSVGKIFSLVGMDRIFYDKSVYQDGNTLPGELKYINSQSDLSKIFDSPEIDVYKNENDTSLIQITRSATLDFTGLDTLKYAAVLGDDTARYFSYDQSENVHLNEYNRILVSAAFDLFALIDRKYHYDLSDYANGTDPSKDFWISGSYLDDASKRMLDAGIYNYEKPISKRFIYTYHQGEIDVPLNNVNPDTEYVVLIKYLPNKDGGIFSLNIDGNSQEIVSKQLNNHFVWKELYRGKIRNKMMRLVSDYGFNLIDSIVVIPADEFSQFRNQIDASVSSISLDYILRAPYDFPNFINNTEVKSGKVLFSRDSSLLSKMFTQSIKFDEKRMIAFRQPETVNYSTVSGNSFVLPFNFDNSDMSIADGVSLNLNNDNNISNISIVMNNQTEGSWPFLIRENHLGKYVYIFPKNIDRSKISAMHLWVTCRSSYDCTNDIGELSFLRLNSELKTSLEFIKSEKYKVITDMPYSNECESLLLFDNEKIYAENIGGEIGFNLGLVDAGFHDIEFHTKKNCSLGVLYIEEDRNSIEDYAIKQITNYQIKNRGQEYLISFDSAENNFDIIFSKKFNSQWKLYDDKQNIIIPKKLFSLVNGYHISNPTDSVTLVFEPSKSFDIGLGVASVALVSCFGYLGYSGIRSYRRRKALRQS